MDVQTSCEVYGDSMSDDLIGKQIGGYEILDRIGRGGMATVYRARQTSMNRIVAMKVLPRHYLQDDTYLQRFEREVKIISQLEHRSIVPVHDYGEHEGQPYIVMRLMTAGSVDDLIKKGPIDPETTLSIVQQIAPALDYAHTKNVLHRDLKPSNILMDDDGGAYITDFGIARIVGTEAQGNTITTQGVVGTPSYMSPEQAQGKSLDGRSDVYSLGVMVFEMMTGRRPFENETPYGIAVMQVTTPPPSPRSINPHIPGSVEQVILKALKKQPENRYQTAVQLAEALRLAIERPESIHDTQPRGLPVKERLSAEPPDSQPTLASDPAHPPVILPPPVYAPQTPPPSQAHRSIPVRARKRWQGNFWLSVIIGSLIGCGLLSLVVVAVIMAVDDLLNPEPTPTIAPQTRTPIDESELESLVMTTTAATRTTEPESTLAGNGQAVATLDPTSEAARRNLLGPIPGADANTSATPVFLFATPIPSRTPTAEGGEVALQPTPTFESGLDAATVHILYFTQAGSSHDVFWYNLVTGERRQLTDDTATSSYPRISPDGTRVVYQSDRDGDFDIYVLDLSSSNTTRLTDNNVTDRLPTWSPDGEWILYSSDTREDGNYDLLRVSAHGGPPEIVYSDGKRSSHARYSHDGRYLVFTNGESGNAATWEILKMELATGTVQILTRNSVRDASPSFSPDDETIVYVTEGEGGAAVAIMNADGSGLPKVIYDGPGFEWGMDYSPNGKYIIFNSQESRSGNSTLYLMRADGSGVVSIENGGGFYPGWMPQ